MGSMTLPLHSGSAPRVRTLLAPRDDRLTPAGPATPRKHLEDAGPGPN